MTAVARIKVLPLAIVASILLVASPFVSAQNRAGQAPSTSGTSGSPPRQAAPTQQGGRSQAQQAGQGAAQGTGPAQPQAGPAEAQQPGPTQAQAQQPGSAQAQSAAPGQPPAQAAPVTAEDLRTLREDLRTGKARLATLLKAVDTTAAEDWLSASPIEDLKQRAAQAGISDAERALWQQAVENEQAAAERVRGALSRADLAAAGKEALDDAEQAVEQMQSDGKPRGNVARALTSIEEGIASLNSRRAQAALELNQRRETLAQLEEQLHGQAETLDQLRRDRDKQEQAAPKGEDPALAEARRAVRDAIDRRSEARVVAAQLDSQTLPARIERLRLEVRARDVETRWLGARLAQEQTEFGERSTEELRALTADLQKLVDATPDAAQRFAAEVAGLRDQIDEIGRLQDRIRSLQQQREDYLRTEADLTQTLADVHERLQIGGLTETLGGLFLEEQRRIRALGDERYALRELEREMAQSRLRHITEREQLRAAPSPDADSGADPALNELRRIQRQVADTLVRTEESLTDQLRQTEVPLRAVASLVDQLNQILSETLLWWPSHRPVSLAWLSQAPAAFMAVLDPASWREIRSALADVSVRRPVSSLLILLLAALVYRAGRPAGRHLRALADKTRHRFTDNMSLTFKAMGWSLVRVLPGPILLLAVWYRLRQIPDAAPAVDTLTSLFFAGAVWWLAGHLLVLFISRNGVGTVHFGWNRCIVKRLRRHLKWYLPLQFVLIIGLALAFGHPSDLVFDVIGRVGLVASGIISGFLGWRVLAPDPDLARTLSERKRVIMRVATVIYAGALIALALGGYLLTVAMLFGRTIDTFVVIVAVWLGYSLAARALILGEMRLRISRMLEQRAKAAQDGGTSIGEGGVEPPEPHLSIEDINHQTRTLVTVLSGAVLVLALFWVWSEVLPALAWLDGVTLWSRTAMVGDTEVMSRVSLQDVLLAVFLTGLFFVATRNLPGLVEIILARTTGVDSAGRYTAATLLRYGIMIAAVVTVFSLLGLSWGELQWMVAALTVGLGFGLQEVVANFVSGIIILFERPARVGDTITIGEYSGTVARIRTRATTIIDGDNREIVVPNKMFITDRLINWTLSDTVTRIVVRVGVGYDADPEVVMQTLKDVASRHPSVLRDPGPTVLFLSFGESTLNFELRGYVGQLRERGDTSSDLHCEILRAFRERGIEIAFPQMDLHIRDLPAHAAAQLAAMSAPAAGSRG
ncbi:MAG TPA: mechanosensitive ion channel domain-containing protein [Gammaproteobacteria bacterium]|nr:mechanosensitive ion channel domain-containing protein [Gammaproteobacteria bacterium]